MTDYTFPLVAVSVDQQRRPYPELVQIPEPTSRPAASELGAAAGVEGWGRRGEGPAI